jgi:hypothetical protein
MLGETLGTIDITSSSSTGYLITRSIVQAGQTITEYPSTVITHIHIVSGSTPSVITVANGQNGNIVINETGTVSKGADFDYGTWGLHFPLGAYVTFDSNQTGGGITCKAIKD